jgi:catechol-2,3-dioxygenase
MLHAGRSRNCQIWYNNGGRRKLQETQLKETIKNHTLTKYNPMDKQLMIVYPKTINHIAVSVTNLDKAVKWYQEVFGLNVINGPVEIVVDDSPLGVILNNIHGPNLKKMRIV